MSEEKHQTTGLAGLLKSMKDRIGTTFGFSADELAAFSASRTVNLILSLPFIAGCADPERTALAHAAVYLLAIKGGQEPFDHCAEDDKAILARLRLISSFKGGDSKLLEKGMSLLALQMLCGYDRDRKKDQASNYYNPLNAGVWNFETEKAKLVTTIESITSEQIDTIMTTKDATVLLWTYN